MSVSKFLKNIDDYLHRFSHKESVLFEAMNSFGFNCQAPVIDALLDHPHIKVGITTSRLGDEDLTRKHITDSGYFQYFIEPKKAIWKKWNLVVCTDAQGVWYKRNHKTAYLQHGISGRGNYPYGNTAVIQSSSKRFDYIFSSSKNIARGYRKYFPHFDDDIDTRVVGFPLLDNALNDDLQNTSLVLTPNKRTILFTSHWDEYSLLKSIGREVLDLLSSMEDFNILLTAHPYNWDMEEQLFSQKKDWKKFFRSFTSHNHVQFLPDQNVSQLIQSADIIISDHSSSTLEYCALNKPVIRFQNPRYSFHDSYLTQLINRATYHFNSVKELENLLLKNVSAEEHQRYRIELTNYCYENLGTSSSASAAEIVKICRETN